MLYVSGTVQRHMENKYQRIAWQVVKIIFMCVLLSVCLCVVRATLGICKFMITFRCDM